MPNINRRIGYEFESKFYGFEDPQQFINGRIRIKNSKNIAFFLIDFQYNVII